MWRCSVLKHRRLWPVGLAPPAEAGAAMMASSRIEVIAAGLTIRLGAGFDSGDLRRVLQIVRELA